MPPEENIPCFAIASAPAGAKGTSVSPASSKAVVSASVVSGAVVSEDCVVSGAAVAAVVAAWEPLPPQPVIRTIPAAAIAAILINVCFLIVLYPLS